MAIRYKSDDVRVKRSPLKTIETYLNIVHYCLYRADYRFHMLSNKVNPFMLLGKIPAVRRKFEEQGTTHSDVVNKIWTEKRFGFGIMVSGAGIVIIVAFMVWGLVSTLAGLNGIYFYVKPVQVILYGAFAYLSCYCAVFKKDKYIVYFEHFEQWSENEKWKYGVLSLVSVAISLMLWLYSFRFTPIE